MNLTAADIRYVIMALFVLVISVALHEFGHAFMAYKLGDDTPKRQGRVTLNPLAHADPIGTFLLPVLGNLHAAAGGGGGGFGWGKPVQWQPHKIRRGISMSLASILVSVAGPSMNLLLASLTALVHVILVTQHVITPGGEVSGTILPFIVQTNFILFFFNLLPLPPLDGGHVAQAFTPYKHRDTFDNFAKYAPFVILGIMLIPQVREIFAWPARWCTEHVYRAFIAIFA